jgi:hypothetical protein
MFTLMLNTQNALVQILVARQAILTEVSVVFLSSSR